MNDKNKIPAPYVGMIFVSKGVTIHFPEPIFEDGEILIVTEMRGGNHTEYVFVRRLYMRHNNEAGRPFSVNSNFDLIWWNQVFKRKLTALEKLRL